MSVSSRRMALSDPLRAALFMIGGLALFSMMATLVRVATESTPTLVVVFFRCFFGLLVMTPLMFRRGLGLLKTDRTALHLLRAAFAWTAVTSGFLALSLIPLAEATALGFTAPLFATLGAALFLGERIRAHRTAALAVGFVGAMIILQPGVRELSFGGAMAVLSALCIASATLCVKRLTATENLDAVAIWLMTLLAPLSLVPALWVWEWPSAEALGLMLAIAACGSAAQLLWTRAWALAEVGALQPFEFLKLPLTAAAGWALFAEAPRPAIWVGGAVIFASAAYIAHREAQGRSKIAPAKSTRRAPDATNAAPPR